ncbi:hypothetical protein QJS10_CPA01g00403 [Acorus calamus]|uniref:Uncharacterized protein n=1 Tax=Acorus calamus TaxID=4465 RepID=A0AAV9FJ73_ACOCL|nr:hypothetical protein QJS10_CPA01g00403 [Acorus calamus]
MKVLANWEYISNFPQKSAATGSSWPPLDKMTPDNDKLLPPLSVTNNESFSSADLCRQ